MRAKLEMRRSSHVDKERALVKQNGSLFVEYYRSSPTPQKKTSFTVPRSNGVIFGKRRQNINRKLCWTPRLRNTKKYRIPEQKGRGNEREGYEKRTLAQSGWSRGRF